MKRLRDAGFLVEPAQTPEVSNTQCRIEEPVRLKRVPVPAMPGEMITLPEEPVIACRFAEVYGQWLGELVSPTMKGVTGVSLKAVHTGPGFECRNRNRQAGGKLSAHAEGLAVDMAGFEFADGSRIAVKPGEDSKARLGLDAIRKGGCGWFTTILGPGSDASHADHLHVDIIQHGSSDRYKICQ